IGHPGNALAVLETADLRRGTVQLTRDVDQLAVDPATQPAQLGPQAPSRPRGSLRSGHQSAARRNPDVQLHELRPRIAEGGGAPARALRQTPSNPPSFTVRTNWAHPPAVTS